MITPRTGQHRPYGALMRLENVSFDEDLNMRQTALAFDMDLELSGIAGVRWDVSSFYIYGIVSERDLGFTIE